MTWGLESTQRFITNSFHNYVITQPGKDLRSLAISSDTKNSALNLSSIIQGQYIGLFRISHSFLAKVIECYENLDRNAEYDSKDFNNMYMTSFLQLLIDTYHNAYMVETFGNWCEIDFKSDLDIDFIRG